jgi:hypothetical protein
VVLCDAAEASLGRTSRSWGHFLLYMLGWLLLAEGIHTILKTFKNLLQAKHISLARPDHICHCCF